MSRVCIVFVLHVVLYVYSLYVYVYSHWSIMIYG